MNTKLTLALVLGIIVLGVGALFLIQRNAPENSSQNNAENSGPNIPDEPRKFVIGHTDIPGYTVAVLNEIDLVDIIQTNNIFGRTYIYIDSQTTGDRPLENITFLLTEQRPEKEAEFGTSDYIFLAPGIMQFNFVVSAEDLLNPDLGNEILRKLIDYSYRLSYPSAVESEVEVAVERTYSELLEKNSEYIIIEAE